MCVLFNNLFLECYIIYRRGKINFLETDSKNRNIGDLYSGTSDFKKDYHPRTNIVNDERGDLVIDCHTIFAR